MRVSRGTVRRQSKSKKSPVAARRSSCLSPHFRSADRNPSRNEQLPRSSRGLIPDYRAAPQPAKQKSLQSSPSVPRVSLLRQESRRSFSPDLQSRHYLSNAD